MPLSVTGNLNVSLNVTETISNGLASGQLSPSLAVALAFGAGTGSGNVQWVWSKSATATAAPVTYTLSALVDDLGRTIALTKVRVLVIAHLGTVDGQPLTVGGASTNPWSNPFGTATDKAVIRAGGVLVLAGPLATAYAVAAGSSDQIRLDPGSATIPFKIMIVGE